MKKKIIIIGAGITGLYSAIILSQRGHNVSIYETKSDAGGILRDVDYNGEMYYRACQFFNADSKWFQAIKILLNEEFHKFEPSYGSFLENENETVLSNDFSVPVFNDLIIKDLKQTQNIKTLYDRINLYDDNVKFFLDKFFKQLNINAKNISENCAINLQTNRVTSLTQKDLLNKKKKENKTFDNIYAIDSSSLNIKYSVSLPVNGFNSFFDNLVQSNKNKINFHFNSKIIPKWTNGKLQIKANKKILDSDQIIWTGNPTMLINSFSSNKMKSAVIRAVQLNTKLLSSNKKFYYVQVFSLKTPIYRIYIYEIKGVKKISVEMIKNDINRVLLAKKIKDILFSLGVIVELDLKNINETNLLRHDLTTINDLDLIKSMKEYREESKLICSPWDIYSRDIKIEYLQNAFLQKGLI